MKVENQGIYPFGDALYDGACHKCDNPLEWEASFDADGTNYYAACNDCALTYTMLPSSVLIVVEDDE